MLGTVSKAGDVMALFTADNPEWGVSQVAERMELAKSSAHALLSTLAEIGLVRRTDSGRYRLGWRVFELHQTLMDTTDFLRPARAALSQLAENLHATVHLATLRQYEVLYLDKATGSNAPVLAASRTGLAAPAHCTAIGKVLLADRGAVFTENLAVRHGLSRLTSRTVTDLPVLLDELSVVARSGWAVDRSETLRGLCCLAVPLRDSTGAVQASLSASMPTATFDRLEIPLRRTLQRASMTIMKHADRVAAHTLDQRHIPAQSGAA